MLRDARAMLFELYGEDRVLSFEQTIERPNPSGGAAIRSVQIRLPKRETLILVSGYSSHMRARIIDRLSFAGARAGGGTPAVFGRNVSPERTGDGRDQARVDPRI